MTVLSAAKRAAIEARITQYETLLEAAYDALEESVSDSKKSYKLDTGEGMQMAVKRSLAEQTKTIRYLEACIAQMTRRLEGGLNANMNVRRKQGGGFRGW